VSGKRGPEAAAVCRAGRRVRTHRFELLTVRIHVATEDGLFELDERGATATHSFAGERIAAVATAGGWTVIAGADGGVRRRHDGAWESLGLAGSVLWSVAIRLDGVTYAGVEPAALFRLDDAPVELSALAQVDGHDDWHSPWGPADLSCIVVDGDRLVVGVEIGGVAVSHDGGRTWQARNKGLFEDVHVVIVDGDALFATTGMGVHRSHDEGWSWTWEQDGIDRGYTQAMVRTNGHLVVASASGPPPMWEAGGPEAAIFRSGVSTERPLAWERVAEGFAGNVERLAMASQGDVVVAGTTAGALLRSPDAGATWEVLADGLPEVVSLALSDG
jgi:hypothetical protein